MNTDEIHQDIIESTQTPQEKEVKPFWVKHIGPFLEATKEFAINFAREQGYKLIHFPLHIFTKNNFLKTDEGAIKLEKSLDQEAYQKYVDRLIEEGKIDFSDNLKFALSENKDVENLFKKDLPKNLISDYIKSGHMMLTNSRYFAPYILLLWRTEHNETDTLLGYFHEHAHALQQFSDDFRTLGDEHRYIKEQHAQAFSAFCTLLVLDKMYEKEEFLHKQNEMWHILYKATDIGKKSADQLKDPKKNMKSLQYFIPTIRNRVHSKFKAKRKKTDKFWTNDTLIDMKTVFDLTKEITFQAAIPYERAYLASKHTLPFMKTNQEKPRSYDEKMVDIIKMYSQNRRTMGTKHDRYLEETTLENTQPYHDLQEAIMDGHKNPEGFTGYDLESFRLRYVKYSHFSEPFKQKLHDLCDEINETLNAKEDRHRHDPNKKKHR